MYNKKIMLIMLLSAAILMGAGVLIKSNYSKIEDFLGRRQCEKIDEILIEREKKKNNESAGFEESEYMIKKINLCRKGWFTYAQDWSGGSYSGCQIDNYLYIVAKKNGEVLGISEVVFDLHTDVYVEDDYKDYNVGYLMSAREYYKRYDDSYFIFPLINDKKNNFRFMVFEPTIDENKYDQFIKINNCSVEKIKTGKNNYGRNISSF